MLRAGVPAPGVPVVAVGEASVLRPVLAQRAGASAGAESGPPGSGVGGGGDGRAAQRTVQAGSTAAAEAERRFSPAIANFKDS